MIELLQDEVSIELELQEKNGSDTGPRLSLIIYTRIKGTFHNFFHRNSNSMEN